MAKNRRVLADRRVTVSISCKNDAFAGDECGPEVARILRDLADRIERDGMSTERFASEGERYTLRDINGNTVGKAYCE